MKTFKTNRVDHRVPVLPIDMLDATGDDFEFVCDYYDVVRRQLRIKKTLWAIDETIGHMDDPVPTTAKVLVYSQHWGAGEVRVPLKDGFTWSDLWIYAEDAVKRSGDNHHTFIEAFFEKGDELEMWTGS